MKIFLDILAWLAIAVIWVIGSVMKVSKIAILSAALTAIVAIVFGSALWVSINYNVAYGLLLTVFMTFLMIKPFEKCLDLFND